LKVATKIDINSDLGEGAGHDEHLMPLISSCSIACGGHFGDENTMRTAVRLAKEYGVKVGAHPSFPDKDNFGRKRFTITKKELSESVFQQLLSFYSICDSEEYPIHHIKLHGALYNYAAKDAPTADAVLEAIVATKFRPKLYLQHGSILHRKAENLIPLVFEAFIDRNYNDDLSLVSRSNANAHISSPKDAWHQLRSIIENGSITTVDGTKKPITASTFCIHGDNENSVIIMKYIRKQMESQKIALE
jgi:5-oxoprolinase (ATP-hydrolysing) subunit A